MTTIGMRVGSILYKILATICFCAIIIKNNRSGGMLNVDLLTND